MNAACGPRGKFWDFKNPTLGWVGGTKALPPYDDSNQATLNLAQVPTGGSNMGGFFCFTTTSPEFSDRYLQAQQRDYRDKYLHVADAVDDLFGKPDVRPPLRRIPE